MTLDRRSKFSLYFVLYFSEYHNSCNISMLFYTFNHLKNFTTPDTFRRSKLLKKMKIKNKKL